MMVLYIVTGTILGALLGWYLIGPVAEFLIRPFEPMIFLYLDRRFGYLFERRK